MISRRQFLQHSSLVSLSPIVPCMLCRAAATATADPDERVLVVVQLDGGNDGLNTVVPHADNGYARARVKLRLDANKLYKLDDSVGLHPNMRAAKDLFDNGRLAIVQGVGYPNPDRSHFRSMKIWQTARFDDDQHDGYGWLGQALDSQHGREPGSAAAGAIYVGEQETPVALWGRRSVATALSRADDLKLQSPVATGAAPSPNPSPADGGGGHEIALRQFVTGQVLSAYAAADEFRRRRLKTQTTDGVEYPDTKLASRLKLISQLIQSGSRTRVFYTLQTGYDTHSAQLYAHARLLREFSGAVKALLDDLQAVRLADRVVVLAFSEFGRRVKENDSQGTDHGTAGPVFLAGFPIRGGLIGAAPDLSNLAGGDLKMQCDFRAVYATILDQWLGVSSAAILGSSFAALPILNE
jgi:uncharacterized protein (DUF1501 family)